MMWWLYFGFLSLYIFSFFFLGIPFKGGSGKVGYKTICGAVWIWVVGTYQIHRVIRWIYIGILFDFEYEESKLFYLELKTMNSREILLESLEILLGAQN